jgi:uncharacterized DUF497 family protein
MKEDVAIRLDTTFVYWQEFLGVHKVRLISMRYLNEREQTKYAMA